MADKGMDGAREVRAATRQEVPTWDILVRLIHWSLAMLILINAVLTNPERQLHEIIGYVAGALVLVRLVWGLIGARQARFSAFPPDPLAAWRHLRGLAGGHDRLYLSHNPAGALMAYNLWVTVLGLAVTGYMMSTVRFFGREWVVELHEAMFNWLMISVVLHLAGVVLDTRLTGVPLVRAMITGTKSLPARMREGGKAS